ncbi:MAG: response regulator, partial [Acidobacteriota bacterium]
SLQPLPAESGSRIRAFLPFIRKVPPHGEVRREMEGRVEEGALCQVLVVDDEAVVLDLVDDLLDRSRYSVYRAHDGVQALEYLAEKTFDVLLIDLQMPEMEGGRLLRTIAEQHPEQAGRVVLTSDEPRTTDPGPTMSADGHLLLPKPFFARDVEAAIHSICTSDQAR